MKKTIGLLLVLLVLLALVTSCDVKKEEKDPYADHVAPKAEDIDLTHIKDKSQISESDTVTDWVVFEIEDYGDIVIRLYPEVAPRTVTNFKRLVKAGFYDGTIFHRVVEYVLIQGGDPLGTGYGGSSERITGEFSSNGFENNLSHKRGVISMAREDSDNNSASSQFFICQMDYQGFDGAYASFGYVVYGMDVVDKIASAESDLYGKPSEDIVLKRAYFANVAEYEGKEAVKFEDIDLSTIDSLDGVTVSDTPTDYVMIDVKGFGKIVIRLFPEVAPITVEAFKSRVLGDFYTSTVFHRVIENFMIQGGDVDGDGFGDLDDPTIFGEFTSNGFENNLKHIRGVVSMARSNHPNSATSQFFICQKEYAYGDGNYAAFGFVVYGMDVVDAIAATEVDYNDKPVTDVVISSVEFVNIGK